MTCCTQILQPFTNESTTTVPYSGDKPTVSVSYFIDGVWQAMGVMTNWILTATGITVDHGGPATGIVKLIQ